MTAGRTSRRLGLVATVALLLVACSSDDAGSGTVADPPAVTFATTPPPGTTTPPSAEATEPAAGTTAPPTDPTGAADPGSTPSTVAPTPAPTSPPTAPPATEPLGDPAIVFRTIGTFDQPLDVAWRAGDPTMYVVEQGGLVIPVRDGVAGDPVLDLTDRTDAGGEQGLLGLTFSLDGRFAYVGYTDRSGDTVIAELPVADDGTMSAAEERVVMQIAQPYGNHNGGNVTIGPDGLLYIGMGDGGSANDPERRALNLGELLGKILRIDPTPSDGNGYTIPADNPFVGVPGARPEIWSVGVRNPWRMSFDQATGDLWFGDVGQGEWEEIDLARAVDGGGRGINFGWSAWEGTHRFNDDQPADGMTPPVFEYSHGDGGCSVSGGAVSRGASNPALAGWYVFGDYCSGEITGLRMDGAVLAQTLRLGNVPGVGAIRAAPDGELYAVSLNGDLVLLTPA